MNVFRNKRGYWCAVLYLGQVHGKVHRKQFSAKTREAVVVKLQEAKKTEANLGTRPRVKVTDRKRWVNPMARFVAFANVKFPTSAGEQTWTYEGYGPSELDARQDLEHRIATA
jgi:hypothetical protein